MSENQLAHRHTMRNVLIATCALAFNLSANAEFKDGNKLLSEINGDNHYSRGVAMGYVMGVADAIGGALACMPSNLTGGQLIDMTKQYLENNPSVRHYSADSIIVAMLGQAWPCKKRGSGI